MARQVGKNFLISFDVDVKQAYQETMKLRGTCRTRVGIVGKTHRFPIFGKGMAVPRVEMKAPATIPARRGEAGMRRNSNSATQGRVTSTRKAHSGPLYRLNADCFFLLCVMPRIRLPSSLSHGMKILLPLPSSAPYKQAPLKATG